MVERGGRVEEKYRKGVRANIGKYVETVKVPCKNHNSNLFEVNCNRKERVMDETEQDPFDPSIGPAPVPGNRWTPPSVPRGLASAACSPPARIFRTCPGGPSARPFPPASRNRHIAPSPVANRSEPSKNIPWAPPAGRSENAVNDSARPSPSRS